MTRGIHWFRNDLRLRDNTALTALCNEVDEWLPVFVLDERVWQAGRRSRPRDRFLLDCLSRLGADLAERGVPLIVRRGRPEQVLAGLVRETRASLVSYNEDVSPFSGARDRAARQAIEARGANVLSRSDHTIFQASEVRTGSGKAFSVYTPYRNKWWSRWEEDPRLPARRPRLPRPIPGFAPDEPAASRTVAARAVVPAALLAAAPTEVRLPTGGERAGLRRLAAFLADAVGRYHEDRDRPDRDGTSRLSPYLRFGALSVRECVTRGLERAADEPSARTGIAKWLDELVWREFYSATLEENPHVLRRNHRSQYDSLRWNTDPAAFAAWCEGRTGYPIVDAGMRQLLATGWMHNRVRMIVASFLTKDLLIDWRRGASWFFEHLVHGDPASNSGGWQWAASTGTDAQPYFRIFNPIRQAERHDPEGIYVRRWIPELRALGSKEIHAPWDLASPPTGYPAPIVDHAERRALCLERFREARGA